MKQCTIKQIPIEILIMIVEMLIFEDALKICCVLGIVEEMAFRYHSFYPRQYHTLTTGKQCNYVSKIYDFEKRKVLNPNLAKAMLKNVKFQSLAGACDKVMFAIISQDLELVKNALKDSNGTYKARDTNSFVRDPNSFGRYTNPFRIACNFGQFAVVKLLVNDYGIDIDNISFVNACEEGHDDIVKYITSHPKFILADPRTNPADQDNQAIINAAREGYTKAVKFLLSDVRTNPADQNNRAIIVASENNHVEIVEILLADPRVDPSARDYRAMVKVLSARNLKI